MNSFSSQWTISELACYTYSLVTVPLYDTLGREAIAYIIDKGIVQTPSAATLPCIRNTGTECVIQHCPFCSSYHLHSDLRRA